MPQIKAPIYKCSNCGTRQKRSETEEYPCEVDEMICNNCGDEMDGDDQDGIVMVNMVNRSANGSLT